MSSIRIKRVAGKRAYSSCYHRRGLVVAVVAVTLVVMISFVALVIDSGRLYVARTELQKAADASSLAAAMTMLPDVNNDYVQDITSGYEWASTIAGKNTCMGESVSIVAEQGSDVTFGWLDNPTDLNESFSTNTPLGYYNAVRVLTRRTPSSPGGQIAMTLAQFMGHDQASVSASAVAVLDDRFKSYRPPLSGRNPLIPFTILKSSEEYPEDTYEYQKEYGDDNFGYDPDTGEITSSDGIPEIRLFPYHGSHGTDTGVGDGMGEGAPGNFGILNVGVQANDVPPVREQVLNGITQEQLLEEIGTSELTFLDDQGSPLSYVIDGTPGVKVGMEDALQTRVGDLIGFFLYSVVVDEGSHALYTIVDIRFGRLVEVDIHGNNKRIIVQPEAYQGPEIQTGPDAPHTHLEICRLSLAR